VGGCSPISFLFLWKEDEQTKQTNAGHCLRADVVLSFIPSFVIIISLPFFFFYLSIIIITCRQNSVCVCFKFIFFVKILERSCTYIHEMRRMLFRMTISVFYVCLLFVFFSLSHLIVSLPFLYNFSRTLRSSPEPPGSSHLGEILVLCVFLAGEERKEKNRKHDTITLVVFFFYP
jgi:hypothetical protein